MTDRCMDGFHHGPGEECGCLQVLLAEYLSGQGFFAGQGEQPRAAGGSGG
jgi:hypothetical protein